MGLYLAPGALRSQGFLSEYLEHTKQNKWYYASIGISAISDSWRDRLLFKYDQSIFSTFKNQNWWNPELSWDNKCLSNPNPDIFCKERFPGAKGPFKFVTEANAMFKTVHLSGLATGALLRKNKWDWRFILGDFILSKFVWGVFWVVGDWLATKR